MKGRKKRGTGGTNDADADLKTKPMDYTAKSNVSGEAEEKKRGGRAKHADGGHVHHESMDNMKHAKHVGKVHGGKPRANGGRAPRASGGRTGSDGMPFSSARKGTNPPGRTEQSMD